MIHVNGRIRCLKIVKIPLIQLESWERQRKVLMHREALESKNKPNVTMELKTIYWLCSKLPVYRDAGAQKDPNPESWGKLRWGSTSFKQISSQNC